jgi:hypothetical protein
METKEMNKIGSKGVVLFGFELNHSQTVLFLILSIIGIYMLPLFLAIEIFSYLFQAIFFDVPNHFRIIKTFPAYRTNLWFLYFYAPVITRIFVVSIFLYLSIHALNRILKPSKFKTENKKTTTQQDRIVKWLGFKLTHGQSLFIICVSLAGIFYAVQFFFESSFSPDFMQQGESLWEIGNVSNHLLSVIVSLVISIIFISLCFYNILAMRRKRTISPLKRTVKNHGLILFILFFAIFLFSLMRIICHIILFTDLANALGITPAATTSYQTTDLIRSVIILIISAIIITTSYFMREEIYDKSKTVNDLTWLRIKLTPPRTIIIISLATLFIIFFSFLSLTIIFTVGPFFFLIFPSFVLFPVILLCYYSINKVLKNKRLYRILSFIEGSEGSKTKWFKFHLKKADSIIFLSVSSGAIVIYVFYLLGINSFLEMIANIDYLGMLLHELVGFILIMIVIVVMLAISVYTIKKTLPSIKSLE